MGLEIILLGVMTLRKYLQVGLPLVCFLWVCFGMCMCVQDLCEVYPSRSICMFFVGVFWNVYVCPGFVRGVPLSWHMDVFCGFVLGVCMCV